jgi:tRNA1(Val) A37 N6-methylase TrmN6
LGLLLREAAGSVIGLEKDEVQVEAARQNARLFGLEGRYAALCADLTADAGADAGGDAGKGDAGKGDADLAVCNPPWRLSLAQRPPFSARRRAALYGTEHTLALFAGAGARRLRRGGSFAAVVGADRLADMLRALDGAGLCPTRLRLVHSRPRRAAVFALLEARRAVKGRLRVEPPLIVHDGNEGRGYSEEARAFCRWL